MKRLLFFCLALMLSACGGAASQSAGTPIPTANVAGLSAGSFKGTISGAVSGDFSGTGSYFKQEEGGLLISLVGSEGPTGASITIIIPAGTIAGIYPLKSYNDAYDSAANKITGVGASFSVMNKASDVDAYSTVSDGTLTLQLIDPMTGSIHFKAKLENGDAVEVQATFYQLSSV